VKSTPSATGHLHPKFFTFKNITNADLRNELAKAKAGKSAGLYKISNKLLKAAGEAIILTL
jgi:hypothetical protein